METSHELTSRRKIIARNTVGCDAFWDGF